VRVEMVDPLKILTLSATIALLSILKIRAAVVEVARVTISLGEPVLNQARAIEPIDPHNNIEWKMGGFTFSVRYDRVVYTTLLSANGRLCFRVSANEEPPSVCSPPLAKRGSL
jgi:hypothetical protein